MAIMQVLATESIDPNVGLRQSVAFVCEGRGCRVHVFDQLAIEPRLINYPLPGPRPDTSVISLGEVFQIEGTSGTFRIERLTGEADALIVNRMSA
jgi:hypothetical protein